ncbi:MAG TPA: rhodanese-like domain-containing protein [Pseudomonas sp.]|uniref:rhodanese-like domain-containing protein n=1 Tax=Pseudomonas sp. TaxID=306 RepID=UPI002BEE4C24|nr:rhodanese-like domain-containing protein [Pseudomonas sp.]HRL93953.1 rhodanese-like domain-containing protein [Pseudomonas sp.]
MKNAHDLVLEAKAQIHEVALEDAEAAIRVADLLLDVREADEFHAGHIPGALNIPRGVLEFKLSNDPALCARELNIVLYCKTSGRAALAACSLQAMGYRQMQSLAGGFDAWSAAGKAQVAANLPNFE